MSFSTARLGLQQRKNVTPSPFLSSSAMTQEDRDRDSRSSTKTQPQNATIKKHSQDGHVLIPLQRRSLLRRYDVGPFVIVYSLLILLDQVEIEGTAFDLFKLLAFPLALVSHVSLVLAQQWRVAVRSKVGYAKSNTPSKWTHCWVRTTAAGGSVQDAEICPIVLQDNVAIVTFRDVVFRAALHDADTMDSLFVKESAPSHQQQDTDSHPQFSRLRYPDDLHLDFYKNWQGHEKLESSRNCESVFGRNTTHIQLPPFFHLLGQQLLAPFFLFQLLCVALWSLDEYWYYAIFTLFALIMFECTVAYSRLKNLERLRGTLRHAYHAYVYRLKQWITITTEELLPGDVVSLSSAVPTTRRRLQPQQERHVPADVLLLKGTAVVDEALLTGESIPQLKGPIDTSASGGSTVELTNLDVQEHKQSVLFGGTLLVSHDSKDTSGGSNSFPNPPDGGVVGFVLRTGFETAQGSLLRTMANSSDQTVDGIYTRDTFVFVSLLLLCAVASAMSVLLEGWHDETRNRFRLLLHVIIIITSVVPPELPMELSLAVTNSVADLMKRCDVFCTEPYRIPWAGRVDVCCFDKTGTLTSDEMRLRGVRLPDHSALVDPANEQEGESSSIPWSAMRVMVACHSLALRMDKGTDVVIGDPMEKAVLQATKHTLQRNGVVVPADGVEHGKSNAITIHHRFAFSSRLKRMSVLVTESGESQLVWALTKGAPETIKTFLTKDSVPPDYDEIYTHHMNLGQRVLTIGYRNLGKNTSVGDWRERGREAIERDLTFVGFLVLDCPLKSDSRQVITELRKSGHGVVMITGDAVLTAAEVARQVGIIQVGKIKDHVTYELRERQTDSESGNEIDSSLSRFAFVPLNKASGTSKYAEDEVSLTPANLKHLREMVSKSEASVCVSGTVLAGVAVTSVRHRLDSYAVDTSSTEEKNILFHPAAQSVLKELVPIISVFARHAPRQKEAVLAAFNLGGAHTLMCGDGTNDVGALKRAHVGISIISAPGVEAKQREATAAVAKVKAEQKREKRKAAHSKHGKSRKGSGISVAKNKVRAATLEDSLRKLSEAHEELGFVELGDASVASPFTSRAVSINCCKDVLQQGRCTLVTMLQIYKILGVNCLVNALVLTKLHIHGVKQGDRQLTILGMLVAMLFLFVTKGKPLSKLSSHRPPSSVLCCQALISIGLQFLVHALAILAATHISLSYVDPWDPSMIPDGSFNRNVLNSCTFILTVLATINTFVVNYRGRPFMEDLRDNVLLVRSAQLCYTVLFVCVLEVFPPLNDLLQLNPMPDSSSIFVQEDNTVASPLNHDIVYEIIEAVGFPMAMCILMVIDTGLAISSEKLILYWFEG